MRVSVTRLLFWTGAISTIVLNRHEKKFAAGRNVTTVVGAG